MVDTIIVRSTSGVLFEFDVPTAALAKERFDQQIAKGDLSVVPRDAVEWITRPDGSKVLVDRAPAPPDEPRATAEVKPKGKGKGKTSPDVVIEVDDEAARAALSAVAADDPDGDDDGNAPVTGD